jgi:glycosyltransferase involved in cell wall biosynthesis
VLERFGERPQLVASDVVAVVSDEVAVEVERLGVDPRRVLVSPMSVDADRFSPEISDAAARRRLGVRDDAFVVGWTGSFRRFHGLELAIDALARLRRDGVDAELLLVGDGAEREGIRDHARLLGVADAVIFAGAVTHDDLPELLAAMDVTVVTARAGEGFHYSPLKMREYMAAGRPVVAPAVGDVARTITDSVDGLLYEPGDAAGLAQQLRRLHMDADLRRRVGDSGRQLMVRTGTWRVQLDRLLASEPYRAACARLGRAP